SQLGTAAADGTFTTFYGTKTLLSVASDRTNLRVATRAGTLTKFVISRSTPIRPRPTWFAVLDAHYEIDAGRLFTTSRSVWSVIVGSQYPQRVDLRPRRVDEPVELDHAVADGADVAVDGDVVWLLDGARGAPYEWR